MKTNTLKNSVAVAATAITTVIAAAPGPKMYQRIKLGVDVHWREYVVVRQIEGSAPQPPQRFTPEAFGVWVKKQPALAEVVPCVYEAGPFGFVLHKRLVALGVKNFVVHPRNWEEYGQKVKPISATPWRCRPAWTVIWPATPRRSP